LAIQAALPDRFKETEIGPIPVDWDVMPLSQTVEYKKTTINPQSCPDEVFDYYSIPAYQVSDNPGLERGNEIRSQKLVVEPGMVLFGKLNPRVPKVWRVISPSARRKIASTEFIPLLPVEGKTCSEFLYYLAWSDYVLPKSQELVSGSTPSRQRVDVRAFLQIPIPLPPLPEQRRIAHVLSTIQRAIVAQDDLIATARETKRSLMHRLFTYGPGLEPAPTKETEIGEIPEHWEVVRLGEVLQTTQYGMSVRADRTGTYPMLRMNNLVNGRVDASDLKYVELDGDKFAKFRVHKDDVLFNRTNSYELVGKTAIFDLKGSFVFASYLIKVVPATAQLLPGYLNYYLNWDDAQRRLKALATRGVSQSNISATKLKGFEIGLPPVPEQCEIVRTLNTADTKITAEEQRKSALEALFQSTLQQLMTGQLRVKV